MEPRRLRCLAALAHRFGHQTKVVGSMRVASRRRPPSPPVDSRGGGGVGLRAGSRGGVDIRRCHPNGVTNNAPGHREDHVEGDWRGSTGQHWPTAPQA